MKWTILSFSKFLGAMLGQISRTHFLFNGKFAIEISRARNSFFSLANLVSNSPEQGLPTILSIMANSARKKLQGQTTIFFQRHFFNKQNTWSRVVKAHLFEWQTACKTQSYFGCFKRKTDIKHHILSACCCL